MWALNPMTGLLEEADAETGVQGTPGAPRGWKGPRILPSSLQRECGLAYTWILGSDLQN